ncbi:MAG: alpha/beta fold hydrolase [Solirubrobacteraceae bacterium]
MIAQELAYRNPRRVGRLILASTTGGLGGVPASPMVLAAIASPLGLYSDRHYIRIAPLLYGERIAENLACAVRHGRLELIAGGSHLCLLQEPERCAELIREFLGED